MIFRKAVLLIHGFAGGSYDYKELGNDLELNRNFDVYAFTLPGHDKAFIKDITYEDWIKKAEMEIEKLISNGYRNIYVIGHSMGGVIAAHLARKYREVKKLVLAAPAFRYFEFKDDKLDIIGSIKKVPKLFKNYDSGEVLSRVFKVPIQTVNEFIKLVDEHQDDIKYVSCPTLILRGDNDDIVPEDSVRYVYDNIKSKSVALVELEGLTHDLFIEARYKVVKGTIENFLRKRQVIKKEIKKM